jgi:hypothetical protein
MKPILTSLAFAVLALGCAGSSAPVTSPSSPADQVQPPQEETACLEGSDCDNNSEDMGGDVQTLDGQTVCTADAMVCSDGSAVGRTGPNCEFAACPSEGGEASNPDDAKVCTADAKQCPDGSSVSRSQADCQFAACP